jgi:peroxiredoxin
VQTLVIDVKETKEQTAEYARRWKFTFPVLLDNDGKVATLYAPPDAVPDLPRDQVPIASNLIIDPDGKIQFYSLLDSANFDARLIRLNEVLERLKLPGIARWNPE